MTLTLEATIDNLDRVLAFLDEQLEANGCPMRTQFEIDVAAEELFVNVANYAYGSGHGMVRVEVRFVENSRAVEICFADTGMPYNPLEREDPDITLPADKREIGGLGIFMVKKSMDGLFYEFVDGENRTTIRKFIK